MSATKPYTIYHGTDGKWHAKFEPSLDARIRSKHGCIICVSSEAVADDLADILVRNMARLDEQPADTPAPILPQPNLF